MKDIIQILVVSLIIFLLSLKIYFIDKEIIKIKNKKVMITGNGISEKIGEINEN